ncbi:hypothetical protein [Varibaculum prostatecancerukia]|uniref:hypothetical protein n=1 Tax=Varibaculum prostatecancerukia TaxID=2811781 RepID=UPI001C003DD6|nr:hypothetical protein [Varibaculum prostatecancerukia]
MSNEQDKEETAGHGVNDADKSSGNQEKLSPAANGEENPSPQTREEDEKQVSAPTLKGEDPDTESEHPDHLREADNDSDDSEDSDDVKAAEDGDDAGAAEDSADAADSADPEDTVLRSGEDNSDDKQFQVPEILPLAGSRSESPEQPDEAGENKDDERVWGNQVGGHVDREEVPTLPAGSAFDVSQISVKKIESVRPDHSTTRRVVAWILGVVAVIALVVVGLYASGILQKIFNPEGAASPKEGARAYYGALLDKDAETLCVLSSPTARGELVAALSKKSEENRDSVEKCTAAAKEAFAQVPDNPAIKLKDMVFAPEKAADAGGVKAILIKDKKGTPLQIMGWQEIDGRWFLAGQESQQKVMMKYQQSLAAGAEGKK